MAKLDSYICVLVLLLINAVSAQAHEGGPDHIRAADYGLIEFCNIDDAPTTETCDCDAIRSVITEDVDDFVSTYQSQGDGHSFLASQKDGAHHRRWSVSFFNVALCLNPDNPGALVSRALAFQRIDQYEAAVIDLNKAIRLQPDRARHFIYRAMAYAGLDLYQLAFEDLDAAIALDPEDHIAHQRKGRFYAEMGLHEEAVAENLTAIEKGASTQAHLSIGLSLNKLGRYEEAIASLTRVLETSQYSRAYLNRAYSYLKLDQEVKARADCAAAHKIDPEAISCNEIETHFDDLYSKPMGR